VFVPLHDHNPLNVIRFQAVTISIIAVNVLIFLATHYQWSGHDELETVLIYGVVPADLIQGQNVYQMPVPLAEEVTLVTYMFVHAGWMHLIGNMLFLWVFGDNVEDALGHIRFLVFYLLCGIAAGLAHTLVDTASQSPLVGASGAIGGVLGAYLVLYPKARIWVLVLLRIPVRLPAIWVLGAWIVFQFFSLGTVTEGEEQTAWWAHIGGFIAGVVLVFPLRKHDVTHEASPGTDR
jgi:membrane associated rhomboid family serine protease